MITVYVENQPYPVEPGDRNLLAVCLSLGFDLPYFCWHPALHSVGACRQCAVKLFKDESDTQGRLIMACMTPVKDGMRISIADPEAAAFRAGVVEWLMVNHPHDCPVCDEGGECHLQDMTVMTGHVRRRYRFTKRTHRNQDLGPFINHEMNRCIQCYRCLRFYRDYAGGRDFDVMGWHDDVYFGRHADGALENEFSGNLVEVCPTGVFTDKTMKPHPVRKWNLQTAPSICVHCGLGCNTLAGERYGKLRRILSRYNPNVNGYFLCDRGRFGYEFVNSPRRLRQPCLRGADGDRPAVGPAAAVARVAGIIRGGKAIGIGSPRGSLEGNFALRELVGPDRFFHGVPDRELELVRLALALARQGTAPLASLQEAAACDAVFVLGEDVTNTAPMLALALRQAVRHKPAELATRQRIHAWDSLAIRDAGQQAQGPCFIATADQTRLDDIATATYRAAPDDLARLGFAVAHALDPSSPDVPNLPPDLAAWAQRAADGLKAGQRPLVVAGTGGASAALLPAAANIAWALIKAGRPAQLCLTVPECNSLGSALLDGGGLESALAALRQGDVDTVVVLENDLYRRLPAAAAAELLAARHVIVLDHLATATTAAAEVVLPAATFAESSGTLVNNEGRAQRFFQVFVPEDGIRASWRWLADLIVAAGRAPAAPWRNLDELLSALSAAMPVFKDLRAVAPPADFRMDGQKIPRQPPRYSGRTAMTVHRDIHEPQPPDDADTPLAFSMEGQPGHPPPALIQRYWAPGWNSAQALNKFQQEVGGPLQGDAPGRRLLAAAAGAAPPYFADVPPAFAARAGEWLFLPAHHIYGAEELSSVSAGVAQRAPRPTVTVNDGEAERLGWAEGREVQVSVGDTVQRLPVKRSAQLPAGVAALPAGLSGQPWLPLPAWGKISTPSIPPVGGASATLRSMPSLRSTSSPASAPSAHSANQAPVPPGRRPGLQAGSSPSVREVPA
ncbi:MAG: NADH-quinone oxidoreductase subunit NuoG [Kiritimatiellaeota bacterium]|nr:NADH-quinone oxidoreductase subunit NuoG [Kiritimatiellota bacterium]